MNDVSLGQLADAMAELVDALTYAGATVEQVKSLAAFFREITGTGDQEDLLA